MWGVAKLVAHPLLVTVPQTVLTLEDVIVQPTPHRSGLRRPSAVGPGLPSPNVISFGSCWAAQTQIAFFAVPGGPCSSLLLPAEPSTRWSSLLNVNSSTSA